MSEPTTPFQVGYLIGHVVGAPAINLAIMLGAAWLLDKVLRDQLSDYYLAFASFAPAALLLVLAALARLREHPSGDPGHLYAMIDAGGAVLAMAIGFAIRISDTDEEKPGPPS